MATSQGRGIIRPGEGIVKAGYGFLIPPNRLTNFEIQKYYQNKPRFNSVFLDIIYKK